MIVRLSCFAILTVMTPAAVLAQAQQPPPGVLEAAPEVGRNSDVLLERTFREQKGKSKKDEKPLEAPPQRPPPSTQPQGGVLK